MRLLSNIIKSRYVYLNDEEKKYIDTNEKSEQFRVIHLEHYKNLRSHEDEFAVTKESSLDNSFVEGLSATVIENEEDISNEYTKEKYNQIIEKANEEAAIILQNAKLEAENNMKILYEEASNRGYKDGIEKSKHEILIEKTRIENLKAELQKEYEDKVIGLESNFAHLVTLYVEKLTGICVEGEKEVIGYLIHNAMVSAEPSKQFVIRVSRDDYDNVIAKKEQIEKLVNGETIVEFMRDNDLTKNQCMIETDTSVINCSLDVMLSGLISDIKLLSSKNV
jgi:flagellar assembly protein FliH